MAALPNDGGRRLEVGLRGPARAEWARGWWTRKMKNGVEARLGCQRKWAKIKRAAE
jgi:hypothetical protein